MVRFFDPRFDKEPDDPRDLRSRSDDRRERRTSEERLYALAQALVALNDRALAKLELPEDVLDAVNDARLITSAAARNRALRLVRVALRSADADAIQKRIENGPTLPRPVTPVETWCDRLTTGGDPALDEFLTEHPEADRQQLRTLARQAAKPAAAAETRRALSKALQRYLR